MTISKYLVFQTVVEVGSLTKAAEILNLTQSGVSHAVASLETEFGFSLLTRDRSGITLTSNGERILTYIRETLKANELLRQEVAAINGLEVGTVRIGTFTSVSSLWLPAIIKEFQIKHPTLEINLLEGDYDDVDRWIASGTVDFGFVTLSSAKSFDIIPLVKDKILCILPSDHPLRQQNSISFAQIQEEPFIMPKWGINDDIRRILRNNNISPKIKYEVAEDQTIIAMVQSGLGISILPEMVLLKSTHKVCAIDLEKTSFRTIGLAFNSIKTISPAAKVFFECTQSWLRHQNLLQ